MAAITASMRTRPAIAIPIAKFLCEIQMLFGSSGVCRAKFNITVIFNLQKLYPVVHSKQEHLLTSYSLENFVFRARPSGG